MSQDERFAIRSRILRDDHISNGAVRLFLFLDDESHGNERISMTLERITNQIHIKERQLRELLRELRTDNYLRVYNTLTGNVYEFYRRKTAGSERRKTAGSPGGKLPVLPYRQEPNTQELPLTPQSGAGSANALKDKTTHRQAGTNPRALATNPRALGTNPRATEAVTGVCRSCRGQKRIFIQAIGWAPCAPCHGTGQTLIAQTARAS